MVLIATTVTGMLIRLKSTFLLIELMNYFGSWFFSIDILMGAKGQ